MIEREAQTVKQKMNNKKVFLMELLFAIMIPIIVWWTNIPTNVLNSNFMWGYLETAGILGVILMFFAGIPVGILGLRKSKQMKKLRNITFALSVLNISVGAIEIVTFFLILCAVLFGGVTH